MTAVNTVTPQTTTTTNTTSSSTSSSTSAAAVNQGLAALATNQQSFLSLLTTQLQNQDPLSPADTTQFTQQITQMTGVEQQLVSNQLLQQLVSNQGLPQAVGMIGQTITATTSTTTSATGASTTTTAPITGVVTGVQEINGQTVLSIGQGVQVPLSSVTGVTATPANQNATSS